MKNLVLVVIIIVLSVITLSTSPNNAYPEATFKYSQKRLIEKITLKLHFNPQSKADYYLHLLEIRLDEVSHIVNENQLSYIESSTHRYAATAGNLIDIVISQKINISNQIKSVFTKHIEVLTILRDKYPSQDMAEWRLLQDDINYLKLYSQQISTK